jgi:anti-anti-sigma regulatory factor
MSNNANLQAHIAYELIDDNAPEVVVVEFLSPEITSSVHALELGEQLNSLIRSDLPRNFVIDFTKVRALGSTAFGEIANFVRRVGRVRVCHLADNLQLGASLIGLDDWVEFADSRNAAIRDAIADARRGEQETVDYPLLVS